MIFEKFYLRTVGLKVPKLEKFHSSVSTDGSVPSFDNGNVIQWEIGGVLKRDIILYCDTI